MPTDLLSLDLQHAPACHGDDRVVCLAPLDVSDRQALASAYLDSYPPGIAASSLAEAEQEIDATLDGEYGVLRADASTGAVVDGRVVGAIMVVERSMWDEELDGPFIIDFFVAPSARGHGVGKALLEHAISACRASGDQTMSLRFGDGTSDTAMKMYAQFGFIPRG